MTNTLYSGFRWELTRLASNDGVIFTIHGKLTTSRDLQGFFDAVQQALQQGATTVVVDLAAVLYVDSAGIQRLVSIRHMLVTAQRKFLLRDPSTKVTKLLDVAGALDLFEIEHSPAV